jgi:hypothetical protein
MMVDAMEAELTVGEALASVGLFDRPGEAAVLMTADPVRNVLASEWAGRDVESFSALYHASGLFRPSGISHGSGRRRENLARVVWLTLDCDLIDWEGYPKGHPERDAMLAQMWAAPQAEIDDEIRSLRATLEAALSELGLPLHRLDYTGYGVCGYLYVAEDDQLRIDACRQVHKELIARLNAHVGLPLVDVQSSDAGTRVTRVPGSLNRKGAIARTVAPLIPYTGETWPLSIESPKQAARVAQTIPRTGPGLADGDLGQLVDALAPHWSAGQKHNVALAFAGMLAKAGVPEEQALALVAQLSAGDEKPWDRAACVTSTYARARSGVTTAGFMAMQGLVPASVLDFIDGILTRYRSATGPRVEVGGPRVKTATKKPAAAPSSDTLGFDVQPIPDVCLRGWIGDYVRLMTPLTEAAPVYHLASALALVGATMGREVYGRYVNKNIFCTNFYLLVGPAGESRKDAAIELMLGAQTWRAPGSLSLTTPAFTVVTDVGSGQALIKSLAELKNILFYVTEYSRLVENMNIKNSSLRSIMITAWNMPDTLHNNSLGNQITAKLPALTTIAAVQPGILADLMTRTDIEQGYANRWLIFPGLGHGEIPEPDEMDMVYASGLYRQLTNARSTYAAVDGGTVLHLSPEAKERWVAWYVHDRRREVLNDAEASMRSRLAVHVRKVTLAYAASEGASRIELVHLEAGIELIEWCWRHLRLMLTTWGAHSLAKLTARIERALERHGPMKKRDIQRRCLNHDSPLDLKNALQTMEYLGRIVVDPFGVVALVEDDAPESGSDDA